MTDITNFNFAGDINVKSDLTEATQNVHIRVRKTRGRKCVTTLENLDVINSDPIFWNDLFKHFKKKLCHCNGSLDKDEKTMLLFGDQRAKIKKYLVDKELMKEDNIKVHGF